MRNKTQAIYRNSVPYVKQFRKYVGSIAGCILFQQLDHWFESKPDGFYKFLERPESNHPQYRDGDSWNEEIGITPDEFRTAFDAIATRYKSKKDYDLASDKFQGKFYCSYYDRVARLTWYFRNHDLVDGFLDLVMQGVDATHFLETGIASSTDLDGQSLETGIASSRNGNCPVLETGIASSNLYTKLTTNLTTNKRADDFFAIAPSSLNQENSFPVQTTPRIEETPNPQSPLSPLPPENLSKAISISKQAEAYKNFEAKFASPAKVNKKAPLGLLEEGFGDWHLGSNRNDWKPILIKAAIAHLRDNCKNTPHQEEHALRYINNLCGKRDWSNFEVLAKKALDLEASEAIAAQQRQAPTEIPQQQSAPQIDPIARKRMIEEARRRVAQQAA